jgi:hypothetical protein
MYWEADDYREAAEILDGLVGNVVDSQCSEIIQSIQCFQVGLTDDNSVWVIAVVNTE